MKKFFLFATALLMSASMFAKTSVITYTASEKLEETTYGGDGGLHTNAFYAADSTQLTVTHTFDEAEGVGTITLDGEVAIIGDNAFQECFSLESVTLPASVTMIGYLAFSGCSGLQSINIPEGVTTIEKHAFDGCTTLQSITLPEGLTTIENYIFYKCTSLTSITIPAKVTKIGEAAFASTGLTSVTIPASVTELGEAAFGLCASLASVTFESNACQDAIGEMAFYEVGTETPALLTLHGTWAKENQPDEDGNWYGGKFELAGDPTTLPTLFGDGVKGNKFFHNGQLIIRKENKNFSVLGQEL